MDEGERRKKFLQDNPIPEKLMEGTVRRLKNEDLKKVVAEAVIRMYQSLGRAGPYHVAVDVPHMSSDFKAEYQPRKMMGSLWAVTVDAEGLEALVARKDVLRIIK